MPLVACPSCSGRRSSVGSIRGVTVDQLRAAPKEVVVALQGGAAVAILYGNDPWQRSDGGSARVQALHRALEPLGVVTLFPEGTSGLSSTGSAKAVKQRYLPLPLRKRRPIRELSAQLAAVHPRLVISAAHSLTPATRGGAWAVWIDHLDLWSSFGRRESEVRRGVARLTSSAQARLWERRESLERGRCDVATAAGYDEARNVGAVWLPNPVSLVSTHLTRPSGKVAGFFANFGYWPNRDAYELLVSEWLPALTSQGWTVVVAGYEAGALPTHPHVRNLGEVSTPQDFYSQVDLSLAPVRLGGGMKVKVVEALSHGRPVLGTPHSFEGLPPDVRSRAVVVTSPPADVSRALEGVDYGSPLSETLGAFQPDRFEAVVRDLAATALGPRS